jgi:hypothetical protein
MTRMLWFASLVGCPAVGPDAVALLSDQDGDGFEARGVGGSDCDDLDPAVNPAAAEVCDGLDNDCDGQLNTDDDDAAGVDWYRDRDRDGFPDQSTHVRTCQALGELEDDGGKPWLPPAAEGEWDCDDLDAEEQPGQAWRFDGDGDGVAPDEGVDRVQCERPPGFVTTQGPGVDCDDADPARVPGAVELCNGVDDDCDELPDDDDPDLQGALTYHRDDDEDGFGSDDGVTRCTPPPGGTWSQVGGDCDDANPDINPGALDVAYDDDDRDCSGSDFDLDGDGIDSDQYGGTDCDDTARWVYPGAPDICDGAVDDCSGGTADPDAETGAYFLGPDRGDDVARAYSDLSSALTDDDTITLAGDGTLFLCGRSFTGYVVTDGDVELTSPQTTRAKLTGVAPNAQYFVAWRTALVMSGDIRLTNVDIDGNVTLLGPSVLEDVDLVGEFSLTGLSSSLTRVGVTPTYQVWSVVDDLTLTDVVASGAWIAYPATVDGNGPQTGTSLTAERTTFGSLTTTQLARVSLTDSSFSETSFPALAVYQARDLEGVGVTFADGNPSVLYRGVEYPDLGANFVCDNDGCVAQ